MNLANFKPMNEIEEMLLKAKNLEITLPELINFFLQVNFYIPSVNNINENGLGFVPLVFDREGVSMASIFSDKSRMQIHQSRIKGVIFMSFKDILKNIPENYGLVINPGCTVGLELLPHGIKNIRRDFLSQ